MIYCLLILDGCLGADASLTSLSLFLGTDDSPSKAGGIELGAESALVDRKSTRLNSSHSGESRMPSSA